MQRSQDVLVLLINKLGADLMEPGRSIFTHAHHADYLTEDHISVEGILDFRQLLLKDFHGLVIDGEVTKAPVVGVEEDGGGSCFVLYFLDLRALSVFDLYLLELLNDTTLSVVERDVDFLFTPPVVAVGAMGLLDLELLNRVAVFLRVGRDFVDPCSLQPVSTPPVEIERLQGLGLIVTNLHAANEVCEGCVAPLVAPEVDLQPCTEGIPV